MLAARIGISVCEWEYMSPYELQLYAAAFADRMYDDAKMDRAGAYLQAVLVRLAVNKKYMPSYESVFPQDIRRKEMTDEEMYRQVQALNRALGGTED